jgi:hypothetical protein
MPSKESLPNGSEEKVSKPKKPNTQNPLPNGSKRPTQSFSARTKKIILKQQLCCQFKDPITQKICGSKWFLQVDHKQSRWANGGSEPKNAQILCGAHNRMKYANEANIDFLS